MTYLNKLNNLLNLHNGKINHFQFVMEDEYMEEYMDWCVTYRIEPNDASARRYLELKGIVDGPGVHPWDMDYEVASEFAEWQSRYAVRADRQEAGYSVSLSKRFAQLEQYFIDMFFARRDVHGQFQVG